jgi:hypothetical protein
MSDRDYTFIVRFSLTSAKSGDRLRELLKNYVNEACSKLEAENVEVTYRLREE